MQDEKVTPFLPPEEPKKEEKELSPVPLLEISCSYWLSKVLASALELNLFTELSGRHLTLTEAQKLLGLQPRPAENLFAVLVGLGLLQLDEGNFSNSPLAEKFLVKGRPNYFGEAVKMIDLRLYPAWGRLTEAIKTNQSQSWKELAPTFDARYSDREEKRLFLECMHGISVESSQHLVQAIDFSNFCQILDVGGGTGAYSIEILRRFPHLKAIVFDLPPALQIAYEKIYTAGYSKIIQTYPGDFFQEKLPLGSDVILMSMVLHGCSPEQVLMLLKKSFEALPDGGTIIVAELMMDDDKMGPIFPALMSLNMLIESEGGRNYSWQEYTDWMKEAGFTNFRKLKLEAPGINGALIAEKPSVEKPSKPRPPTQKKRKVVLLPEFDGEPEQDTLSCLPLMQLATSFWPSKALAAAIDLDLFTEMNGRSPTLKEASRLLKLHPRPTEMLLTACVALGLLQMNGGEYSNTPLAQSFLVKGKPGFFGHVIKINEHMVYPAWNKLTQAIKTNRPQINLDFEDYYKSFYSDRLDKRLFLEGVYGVSVQTGRILARQIDFTPFKKLMDLGGGSGANSIEILRRASHLKALLFDLPPALAIAHEKITAAGFAKWIELYPGDFFRERLPLGCDVILISMVVIDWAPEKNLQILKKCYEALPSGGAVIVADMFLDDDKSGPLMAAMFSLDMLLETEGGRTYSWKEILSLLQEAGFQKLRQIRIESPTCNGVVMGYKP